MSQVPQMIKSDLLDYLSKYNQQHLVSFWDELNENEKKSFYNELISLNYEEINNFFQRVQNERNEQATIFDSQMQPVPNELKGSVLKSNNEQLKAYERLGLEAIANNEVAVMVLAGGQGTRLGVNYPKGMYSVNLPSDKTLYQLQAERILKIEQLSRKEFNTDSTVPWYIMTSEHTQEATISFFQQNKYFGLKKENIRFFEQGTLPCLTHDGKIILDTKNHISRAPDGNGGLYRALVQQKILDDMQSRGVKYVHVYCVDNILVRMADPIFIGFCLEKNANCAAKVVQKAFPEEAVGVICKVGDRFQVVEYSEIPADKAKETNADGELTYNAGNICNHFFTTDFLNLICRQHEQELKHHVAQKKIPYVDQNGQRVTPDKPNGIKLEKFIFDVFPFTTAQWSSGNFAIWEVIREEEFSPLKNSNESKKDSPDTCKRDLMAMHYKWLSASGAQIKINSDQPVICEISPLVSYNGEGLSDLVNGKVFTNQILLEQDSVKNGFSIWQYLHI